MTVEPQAFEQFEIDQRAAISRIARATRGTHNADEVTSEAWILAQEIGAKRDRRMDLSDPSEQDTLLGWLYTRFVKFVKGKFTKTSLDQEPGENTPSWHELLAAPEESEPLNQLIHWDELSESQAIPVQGYTEFSAYIILLKRCDLDLTKLASYLAISFDTLKRRIDRAQDRANHQPSLFDGVERIDPGFLPRQPWINKLLSQWRARKRKWQPA